MTEIIQDHKIAVLLVKAFTGIISPEEEEELAVWKEEHPELFSFIMDAENKEKRDRLIRDFSVEEGWEKVRLGAGIGIGKKKFFRRWTAVAAAVVICLCAGTLLFWIGNSVQQSQIPQFAGIEVGASKALLITSGGEQILLEDTTTRRISLEQGVVALNDGKKVLYTTENMVALSEEEIRYNTIKVPRGGEYELILPDHTKVRLNSATELRFPVRFEKNRREVYLAGEAFFSVTKDEKRPFIVQVGGQMAVEVLGTEFNVMAYTEDDCIETTLNRGKVRVTSNRVTVELNPDEQAVYSKTEGRLSTRPVDAEKFSAWKDGKFIFENASLESIMIRLSRWYNIHVFYQNQEAKEFHFTGDLERYDDFGRTLRMLEKATNVRFHISNDNVVVSVK